MTDAPARLRDKLAALDALPPGAPVPSPCNNVCRIDPASGWCEGCLRTLEEIAAWGTLGEADKRDVWRRLRARASNP